MSRISFLLIKFEVRSFKYKPRKNWC